MFLNLLPTNTECVHYKIIAVVFFLFFCLGCTSFDDDSAFLDTNYISYVPVKGSFKDLPFGNYWIKADIRTMEMKPFNHLNGIALSHIINIQESHHSIQVLCFTENHEFYIHEFEKKLGNEIGLIPSRSIRIDTAKVFSIGNENTLVAGSRELRWYSNKDFMKNNDNSHVNTLFLSKSNYAYKATVFEIDEQVSEIIYLGGKFYVLSIKKGSSNSSSRLRIYSELALAKLAEFEFQGVETTLSIDNVKNIHVVHHPDSKTVMESIILASGNTFITKDRPIEWDELYYSPYVRKDLERERMDPLFARRKILNGQDTVYTFSTNVVNSSSSPGSFKQDFKHNILFYTDSDTMLVCKDLNNFRQNSLQFRGKIVKQF